MTGPVLRLALVALFLATVATMPAAAETWAFVDVRPVRALRLAAVAPGPEIPGVTYPRNAPPDLAARDTAAEPENPEVAVPEAEIQVSPAAPIAEGLPPRDAAPRVTERTRRHPGCPTYRCSPRHNARGRKRTHSPPLRSASMSTCRRSA